MDIENSPSYASIANYQKSVPLVSSADMDIENTSTLVSTTNLKNTNRNKKKS